MRTPSKFSTAPVVVDESRPRLRSPDLCASYQWPFHLRVHPDRWEYTGGSWRLEIERVHLRPGVAGVKGKEGDLGSIRDTALLGAWATAEDRKWVILSNGDKRLSSVFPDGLFLDSMAVSVVESGHLRAGSIQIASWEHLDAAGNIVDDAEKLALISAGIATALWGLNGPTAAARARVISGMTRVFDQLENTGSGRPNGGSPSLKRRLDKLRSNLFALTGDPRFAPQEGAATPRPAPPAAAPVADPHADALAVLRALPPAELARLLAGLSASAAPPAAPPPPQAQPELPPHPLPATQAPAPKRTPRLTSDLPPIPGM